jgi:hypothetical protein
MCGQKAIQVSKLIHSECQQCLAYVDLRADVRTKANSTVKINPFRMSTMFGVLFILEQMCGQWSIQLSK